MDAGNLLKPMLGRGELRCIGATTLDEYRKYIEKDPALERRFQQVYVDQPTVEDTVSILRGLRERYELHHGVRISDGALVEAAILSDRYISGRFLPDKGNCYNMHMKVFYFIVIYIAHDELSIYLVPLRATKNLVMCSSYIEC